MHHFSITLEIDEEKCTTSVFFPCEISSTHQNLSSEISKFTNVRLSPSRILFICPVGLEAGIKEVYMSSKQEFEDRLQVVGHVAILPVGRDGKLAREKIEHLLGDLWEITDEFLVSVFEKCVETAMPSTNFKMYPPQGYMFRKPSGHEVDIFLRAGNLLSEQGLLIVFCYLILRRMGLNTEVIYIDSFTILSFALRIQSLIAYFSHQDAIREPIVPKIKVFHSYEIESKFRLTNTDGDYCVIISASTSHGLADKLINEHEAEKSRIVHILGMSSSDSELNKSSIYFEEREFPNIDSKTNKVIGITNEEFMVSYGNPTRVRLSTEHVCKKLSDELTDGFYRKHLRIGMSGDDSGYGPHSVFVIDQNSNDDWSEAFIRWLKYELIHELPATTSTIIHLDDPKSKMMGQKIRKRLKDISGKKKLSLVSKSTVESESFQFKDDSAVVVVGFQDPGLEQLGNLSRELRKHSNLFQHYVLGYAFPESRKQFKRMTNDIRLTQGPKRSYGWSEFLVAATGAAELHESVLRDYGVNWANIDSLSDSCLDNQLICILRKRGQQRQVNYDSQIFFPSLKCQKLRLRGGSIFISDSEKFEDDQTPYQSEEVVYLAVSVALQEAREESSSLASDMKFDQNPFVKTVIDPMMFWRFNDGILQAALLRALAKSELDFSSNEEMSLQFRKVAISVLENANNDAGEAALEFLAAVAKGKVSLRHEDFNHIRNFVENDSTLIELWNFFSFESPI